MSTNDNIADRLLMSFGVDAPIPDSVSRRQANYDRLAARVDAGVDAEYIAAFENFHGMEHADIYRLAQSINPVAMTTLSTEWAELGKGFSFTVAWGTLMIRSLIAQHWEGAAGEAAAAATLRFGESAQQLSDAARATAEKLRVAADVGERVRSSVPPPSANTSLLLQALDPVAAAEAARHEEAVRTQAVRVMEALYKPYYRDSGTAVPVLPSPFATTTDRAGDTFTPSGYGASEIEGSRASGTPTRFDGEAGEPLRTQGPGAPGMPGEAENRTADPQPGDTVGGTADDSVEAGRSSPHEPAPTTPASTASPADHAPDRSTGQPYGSPSSTLGGNGGGGLPGSGGSGGAPSPASPSPLVAGAAPTGGGAAGQPATAATRGGGTRPFGMMPGMIPPASSRNDEQDKRVASYLVTDDHGHELIGALPDTAPPVLGADPL